MPTNPCAVKRLVIVGAWKGAMRVCEHSQLCALEELGFRLGCREHLIMSYVTEID
jgi:hypothetical protein